MRFVTVLAAIAVVASGCGPSPKERALERYNAGVIKMASGDHVGARADFDEAIRLDPSLADAWVNRGGVRLEAGDAAGAVADYTEALRLNPRDASVLTNRAIAHRRQKNHAAAAADATAAIALTPRDPQLFHDRGIDRLRLKQYGDARADFDKAIEFDGQRYVSYAMRAQARHVQGDPAGAIADLETALRIAPGDAADRPAMQQLLEKYRLASPDSDKRR